MVYKRILLFLVLMVSVFTLSACGGEEIVIEEYNVSVSANIQEASPIYFESAVVEGNRSYVFSTSEIAGYTFEYWYIEGTDISLSTELSFVFSPITDLTIEAYYTSDETIIYNRTPDSTDLNMDMDVYYDDAEGLYGEELIDALHTILNNGFSGVTYGEARYILDESDMDPNNPNNIILVYLRTSTSGVWDSGNTWNREHVWPQSLLGEGADNGTVNIASDLFNLMPANPQENSDRSNYPFTEVFYGYEPHDDVKGDIARALFYMMIMYEELNLVNEKPIIYEMGYLDELLAWHYEDPVSDFELNRLDVIYSYQNNRNPFVDYPHLVDLIWDYNKE